MMGCMCPGMPRTGVNAQQSAHHGMQILMCCHASTTCIQKTDDRGGGV